MKNSDIVSSVMSNILGFFFYLKNRNIFEKRKTMYKFLEISPSNASQSDTLPCVPGDQNVYIEREGL
jgi:hypothetical protein